MKKNYLLKYTQIFENVFLGIFVSFDFHSGISNIFGSMIRFSQNSTISVVSGTFLRKYLSHLSPFPKCPNLWLRYFSGGKARCNLDSSIIDHVRHLNILTWPRGFCSFIPKSDLDTKTPPRNMEVRLKASGDVRRLIPVERGPLSIIIAFRLFVQVVGNNSVSESRDNSGLFSANKEFTSIMDGLSIKERVNIIIYYMASAASGQDEPNRTL